MEDGNMSKNVNNFIILGRHSIAIIFLNYNQKLNIFKINSLDLKKKTFTTIKPSIFNAMKEGQGWKDIFTGKRENA
jgi:hypothetical protein